MFAWRAHKGAVTSLAFGPGGRFLVSAGADGCVKVWEPFTGTEQFHIALSSVTLAIRSRVPLGSLGVSDDGKWAAVHEYGRRLLFLSLEHERIRAELNIPYIHALQRTPDGGTVALLLPGANASAAPEFRRYYFDSCLDPYTSVTGHSPLSRALMFSPDGTRIAIGRTVQAWPPGSKARITQVDTKSDEPEALAFSADNRRLFALIGREIAVYSLPNGRLKTKLIDHQGKITAMALAPDGRRLWTASRDATVKCWDTHALTLDRTFTFQTGGLDCLAVSPDGNVAAVGSGQKGTITVWDLG